MDADDPSPPAIVFGGTLGIAEDIEADEPLNAVNLGLRASRGPFALDLGGSLQVKDGDVSGLETALLTAASEANADVSMPVWRERGSLRLCLDVGANGRAREGEGSLPVFDTESRPYAGAHFQLGVELARGDTMLVTVDDQGTGPFAVPSEPDAVWQAGPVVGVGLTLGRGRLVAGRLLVLDHFRPNLHEASAALQSRDPSFGDEPSFEQRVTIALEVQSMPLVLR